jgi:2-polyprenyl-3-methyl-5-hydroxy-6-metoxy-1,4-benzoquinol methylase
MNRDQKFWDRIAERYSKRPIADEAAYQKKLEVTRHYFRPDSDVLEIACGTGSTAIAHAPHVKHILATDISPNMIEIARSKAEAAGISNAEFRVATIKDLDAADESYDAVMAHSILHLLEDWECTIGKVYKMLNPGGAFISSTACLGDNLRFIRWIEPIGRLFRLMPKVSIFTTQELETALTDAGFTIDYEWQKSKKGSAAIFIVATRPPGGRRMPG